MKKVKKEATELINQESIRMLREKYSGILEVDTIKDKRKSQKSVPQKNKKPNSAREIPSKE